MILGALPFVAAGLDILRHFPGGHGFKVIPNVDARPEALVAGAIVCFIGAYMRRRLSIAARRSDDEPRTARQETTTSWTAR